MKTKIATTLTMLLVMATSAFAQREKAKEEIKTMKIGFITQELSLTAEEAQKFWPVYNEFQEKTEKLRAEKREICKVTKSNSSIDSLSNAEVEKMVDKEIVLQEKELQLKKEFHAKIKTVLPIKKVAKLYRAEREFRKHILKKMKDHHKEQGKGEHHDKNHNKGEGDQEDDR
jgi:Spy/CpxP family protein refolding chaperone